MAQLNILILAEDSDARQPLVQKLENDGYRVTLAPTNAEIVSALRASGYDAVLVDMAASGALENVLPRLEEVERRHIERVLNQTRYNLSRASRILDIDRTTLYNKLRRYGLQRESIRARRVAVQTQAQAPVASATQVPSGVA